MSRPHLWYGDGSDSPRTSPSDVLAAAGFDPANGSNVTLGWTIERHSWIDDASFRAQTVLAGYGLGRAVNDGRVTALPVRLSAVPSLIEEAHPDVAIITGVRRGDGFAHGSSVGWADVLARSAGKVVVELDGDGVDLGAPLIDGNIVATVPRPAAPIAELGQQFQRYRECVCEMVAVASNDRYVFTERRDHVTMIGFDQRIFSSVNAVFEFDEHGRIVEWREYWDALDIATQLGLNPDEMRRLHGIEDTPE